MRIAVINWSSRMAGGAETYLRKIMPALREQGHEIAFIHESELPADRELLAPAGLAFECCVDRSGVPETLTKLSAWYPDLLFVHGLVRHDWLEEIVRTVPTAFYCHDYAGICISGTKTFRSMADRTCNRAFGWQCLTHYYPCHCGGWSPVTMLREYQRQSDRLKLMRLGKVLITASTAMQKEYMNNGFALKRVQLAPPMPFSEDSMSAGENSMPEGPPWRLLFAGRMEWLKGGSVFLDALPLACAALDQPLHVTFNGDGRCREMWQQQAEKVRSERLQIEFTGWRPSSSLKVLFAQTHLLVMPSLWPEPFGVTGVEAGRHGVPVAAFQTGGIPDWLTNGVNGFLAPAEPPRAQHLADAIVKCLENADTYRRLRSGAAQVARKFSLERHLEHLNGIFTDIVEHQAA